MRDKESYDKMRARANELRRIIHFHNYRYHVIDAPLISDYEFDRLFRELQEIEEKYPQLVTADSPTQRVGGEVSDAFVRVEHPTSILSLANAFDGQEVRAWYERITKLNPAVENADFVVEPKLDGLTVVLHYERGVFTLGATRGDGEFGEDITANLRTVRSLPLRIPVEQQDIPIPDHLVVRGEAIILRADFDEMNRRFEKTGEKVYVNPRNAASGALRQLDPKLTAERPISLYCYSIVFADGPVPDTQWEIIQTLRRLGFPISADIKYFEYLEHAIEAGEEMAGRRQSLPYELDGVVIKLNDLELSRSLGVVGKDPRGAVAMKFPAQIVTTKLLDVQVNVGRTGVITPYAVLEPIQVGGVTVRQATLHNFDFIEEKDIRIGDRVLLKRAGDVIPYVIGPVIEARDGEEVPVALPEHCPSCGEPLEKVAGEVAVYCGNAGCPAQLVRNVEHFAARGAMDIEGLGIKVAEQLVEAGLLKDIADLYRLTKTDLLSLEGFAERKAENLLEAIQESKTRSLSRLLGGLGIRGVGEVVASDLARRFHDLNSLANAPMETLEELEGIGPNIARAIVDWFQQPRNQRVIEKLRESGLWPSVTDEELVEMPQPLSGLTFVLTGTLPNLSRSEAKKRLEAKGGKVTGSVSGRTNYLVAGASPGSKLQKAQKLGIPVIDEEGMLALLSEDLL